MSQPVKLSDDLILDARLTAQLAERSIAGQIEFWARLGRAVEGHISGDTALALRQKGDGTPLSELISSIDAPAGRNRVRSYLENQPYPHYETATDRPGLLIRTEQDGTRTVGRFINREFQVLEKSSKKSAAPAKLKRSSSSKNRNK